MNRWYWCLTAFFLSASASTGALPRSAAGNDVYLQYVAAPSLNSVRDTWCGKIAARSIPENFSTEDSMEESSMAEEQLLAKQLDCRFLGAFYAELRYAAVSDVLGVGAWRSCLRFAPVGHLTTAPELGIYLQCLRIIQGTKACRTVRSNPTLYTATGNGAACANVLARNDWSQSGEPEWSGTPRSLFHGQHLPVARSPPGVLHLPTQVTLRGTIRTGFSLNCCTFGVGYVMPFAYLHRPHAVTVSDWVLGTITVRDIQLDRAVVGSQIDIPVSVACKSLHSGQTAHDALGVYCEGASIQPLAPPEG